MPLERKSYDQVMGMGYALARSPGGPVQGLTNLDVECLEDEVGKLDLDSDRGEVSVFSGIDPDSGSDHDDVTETKAQMVEMKRQP